MKYLLLFFVIGCTTKETPPVNNKAFIDSTEKAHGLATQGSGGYTTLKTGDSNNTETRYPSIAEKLRLLKLNHQYYKAAMDYKSKRDEMEILYLKTEDDKHRIRGNRYSDSAYKYGLLANKYDDSLKAN